MKLRKLSWLSVSLAGMRKYGFIFGYSVTLCY